MLSVLLPEQLFDADTSRAVDRQAIGGLGIPGIELMRRAGRCAFDVLSQRWPSPRRAHIVSGTGNNGGDGFIVARLAQQSGYAVTVTVSGALERIRGDAAIAFAEMRTCGIEPLSEAPHFDGGDIVVDALFGTGLARAVDGRDAALIEKINGAGSAVLAVDVPSGLDASTGLIHGCAVRADVTTCFMTLKQGLFTGAGPNCAGAVLYDSLNVPADLSAAAGATALRRDYLSMTEWFPRRSRAAHKGHFGHVLVAGGMPGFGGAARLAAEAAARVGAGLVSLATHPAHASALTSDRPELMCHGVARGEDLRQLIKRASVIALGPGLGQDTWGQQLYASVRDTHCMQVLDADALNLLAREPDRDEKWVLTPHPGEAARLLGTDTAKVERDRFAAARALQERYGGVVVLKGSGTIIQACDQLPVVIHAGNPGMASGGMGDVLTGVIAGLLGQGFPPFEAAVAGAVVHGHAADQAAAEAGERGLLAGDLMAHLRRAVNPQRQV
jgi:hydroxyethylthiazole kinase-like uncharacterized protein yjeF